ncbi:putative transposase [Bradyrhizobium sp. GM24.11]
MKRSRFTEEQIIGILEGARVRRVGCRSMPQAWSATPAIYKWKVKFGGMEVPEAKRLKTLEDRTHG